MKSLFLGLVVVLGTLSFAHAGGVSCKDSAGNFCGILLPPRTCVETCAEYQERQENASREKANEETSLKVNALCLLQNTCHIDQ